jgi:hypothetical protein
MQTINLRQFMALARSIQAVIAQMPPGSLQHPSKPGLDLRDWWAYRDFTATLSLMGLNRFESAQSLEKLAVTTLVIGRIGSNEGPQSVVEVLDLEQEAVAALRERGIQVLHHRSLLCHQVAGVSVLLEKFRGSFNEHAGFCEGGFLPPVEGGHLVSPGVDGADQTKTGA